MAAKFTATHCPFTLYLNPSAFDPPSDAFGSLLTNVSRSLTQRCRAIPIMNRSAVHQDRFPRSWHRLNLPFPPQGFTFGSAAFGIDQFQRKATPGVLGSLPAAMHCQPAFKIQRNATVKRAVTAAQEIDKPNRAAHCTAPGPKAMVRMASAFSPCRACEMVVARHRPTL